MSVETTARVGGLSWLRARLFRGPLDAVVTLAGLALIFWFAPDLAPIPVACSSS